MTEVSEAMIEAGERVWMNRKPNELTNPLADCYLAMKALDPDFAKVGEIERLILARQAIYKSKQYKVGPSGEDFYTRWDLFRHTVEAFDLLLDDLAALRNTQGEVTDAALNSDGER